MLFCMKPREAQRKLRWSLICPHLIQNPNQSLSDCLSFSPTCQVSLGSVLILTCHLIFIALHFLISEVEELSNSISTWKETASNIYIFFTELECKALCLDSQFHSGYQKEALGCRNTFVVSSQNPDLADIILLWTKTKTRIKPKKS